MKVLISYSIFNRKDTPAWIFRVFLRGVYFNTLMNSLVYKDATTHIEVDSETFSQYEHIFYWLQEHYGAQFNVNPPEERLCMAMLWRMKPIFETDADYVFCRDADALTTWREAKAVNDFIKYDKNVVQGITDNPAHGGVMGGMCGFKCLPLRDEYPSWLEMFSRYKGVIDKRGSDQDFLNAHIAKRFTPRFYDFPPEDKTSDLWTSSLCVRHIGSPGVVEMETIRFFERHLKRWREDEPLWIKYPKIFYWHE